MVTVIFIRSCKDCIQKGKCVNVINVSGIKTTKNMQYVLEQL